MTAALAIPSLAAQAQEQEGSATTTPIKHVVVIFQENVSFDHYFGTYPVALNPAGEPAFTAAPNTPRVDGLDRRLLTENPNLSNPQRLDRSQNATCDMDHDYTREQMAFDGGRMDQFVQNTSDSGHPTAAQCTGKETGTQPDYAVMDYYDGNTVTAMWNYAQRFAMSDHSFQTGFGPSTVGALDLVAGNTYGAACTSEEVYCAPGATTGTVTDDPQPAGDICDTRDSTTMKTGRNVGDLLNAKGVSWGFFEGGFSNCAQSHTYQDQFGVTHTKKDYIPHHEPFQYFASTANLQHLPPTSTAMIGKQGDRANHQYDLTNFWQAVDAGNMPAVSYLKAAGYQDGHAGYSSPLAEQQFLVETINRLQKTKEWASTAVIISYDDSDGWYDHVMGPTAFTSQTPRDALNGPGRCGDSKAESDENATQPGRCGYGPRLPLMVISPYSRSNSVDHHLTDQSSILKFIEDNWRLGRIGGGSSDEEAGTLTHMFNFERPDVTPYLLDPHTGLVDRH